MKTFLTLGHGYCAAHLTPLLQARGWQVMGSCRSAKAADQLAASGVTPVLWDGQGDPADLAAALRRASHVLLSAPPDADGNDPFLKALPDLGGAWPDWIGYLSTTGVYGDTGGAWVDEDSPLAPARGRSTARMLAERQWLKSGLPVQIFRLSGIYGPGRSAFDKLRDGTARRILKPGQVFSRIHVADIAGAVLASMARPDPGRIYNLCDDLPAPADEVLAHAAALLGIEPPPPVPIEQAGLGPMAQSFYAECRRVRNDRVKRELGLTLTYPDYRAGLAAILREESAR